MTPWRKCPGSGIRLVAAASVLGLTFILAVFATTSRSQGLKDSTKDNLLPPFLEAFRGKKAPSISTKEITIDSAVGRVRGLLSRPDTPERLPAVLVLHGEAGLTDWMKENARDLASIGYVVLALDMKHRHAPAPAKAETTRAVLADEATLAELSAAVRSLRRRLDVWPDRIGVVGWSWGGGQALALAASTPLQACVVCDGPLIDEPALLGGLRGTPLLGVFAGTGGAVNSLPAFEKALAQGGTPFKAVVFREVTPGFMGPPERKAYATEAAEKAYVEVYEFLGKFVEDAPLNSSTARPATAGLAPAKTYATIADIMRAVNAPTGVRGTLLQALAGPPARQQDWDRVRANAAILAEAGALLRARRPPKGARNHWLEQAEAFTAAAESIMAAGERRDYAAAQRGLQDLSARCAPCHRQHR